MWKNHIKNIALTFLVGSACQAAFADEIKMKNGDVITGTIVKKEASTVVFKTTYAGEISIQWSEVESLKSTAPVHVILSDGSNIKGPLVDADPGTAKIVLQEAPPQAAAPAPAQVIEKDFDLQKTRYINPSPDLSGEGTRWSGNINAGGSDTSGNTQNKYLHVDAETVARTLNNRYTVGGLINRSEDTGQTTQSNNRAYGKYDRFFTKQWYGYVNSTLDNDKFRDLRLRTVLGAGNGYQIYETPNMNLSVEAGLNYINEDFYLAPDDHYPGARWAIKFDRMLYKNYLQLFHEHEGLLGLQQTDHLIFTSKTGLRFPLVKNLNASTQYNYNLDTQPSPGSKKVDSVLLFTLGYGW